MPFRFPWISTLALALVVGCQGGPNASNATLETDDEVISYAFGRDIGRQLAVWDDHLDLSALLAGIEDMLEERDGRVSDELIQEARERLGPIVQAERETKAAAEAEENLQEGLAFLAENGQKDGVMTTPSGLQYQVLRHGDGPRPREEDRVSIHYKGTLIDGTEFDSSYEREQPATFGVTGVISGFSEGLMLMTKGSQYRFYIPGAIAYGTSGSGQLIGPNATLIFEVELISIQGK